MFLRLYANNKEYLNKICEVWILREKIEKKNQMSKKEDILCVLQASEKTVNIKTNQTYNFKKSEK